MSERYVGQLHSADDLIAAVEEYGFLPFFQNEIPGFSVEELCAPELWFADDADGPWEWKGPAARSGKCLYGKIFNKRAGFVSRDWIPDFANFRRDGYDFDARWDDGLTSYKDKELYETIADEGTVLSKRLKELRNYRKGGNTGFETCITRLQMQSYVCISFICRTSTEDLMAGALQSMRRRKSFSGTTLSRPPISETRRNPENIF